MEIIAKEQAKERIAKRIAQEFNATKQKLVINLGVGTPTLVANYVTNPLVFVQAENGLLGVGPKAKEGEEDTQLINAGREKVTQTSGCCFFDSATSFGMIRGARVDATVLGAFEVDEKANIANWIIPNGKMLGVGGAMDLVSGAKKVIIAMMHTTDEKPKLLHQCSLPITGYGEADLIVTELAVFAFEQGKMILKEYAPEVTPEQVRELTEARYEESQDLKVMDVS
jgi:3-oxoacid CoA-transferase B subunit